MSPGEKRCPRELRLTSVYDEGQKRGFQVLRNTFRLAATTIGANYMEQGTAEPFSGTLTKNLKIKSFTPPQQR